MGITCNLCVLFSNAFCRIDHDDTDIGFLDRGKRTDHTVLLYSILDTALLTETGSIDDRKLTVLILDQRVDRVSRSTRDIRDDRALGTGHIVGKRGFTRIRLTDQGDTDRVILLFTRSFFRELLVDRVEHLTKSQTMGGRDRVNFAETEVIELIELGRRFTDMVDLVYCKNDRTVRFSKHRSDLLVSGS